MASMIDLTRVSACGRGVRRATAVVLTVVLAAGTTSGLAGCDGTSEASEAVRTAALEMQTLSLGGANPIPGRDYRVESYQRIAAKLRPHTTGGSAGTTAAANLLLARAQAGLGGVQAEELAEAERRTLTSVTGLWAMLDRYLGEQVSAEALEQYDPTPELADLDKQIRAKEEDTARVIQQKQALERELAELEARAAAESEKARAQRLQETKLRQRAANLRAVEQAQLIEQANEHKRQADAHDKEASLLRAQIAQRQPEVREFDALIARLTDQRGLLDEAKKEVQAFANSTRDRAKAARAEAENVAKNIRNALEELKKLRAEIPELADKTLQSYSAAVSAANAAARGSDLSAETRAQAKLTAAASTHARADILALRAEGATVYAKLVRALADAEPPLPNAAELRQLADGEEQKALDLKEEAEKALAEATEAYANAGGRGEAQERLQRLTEELKKIADIRSGKRAPEVIADASATPGSGDAGEPAAAAAGDAEAEIREALRAMAEAGKSGDMSAIDRFIHAGGPAEQEMLAAMQKVMAAFTKLDQACKDKFGKSMNESVAAGTGGMPGMMPEFDADSLQISVVSPTAAVVSGAAPGRTLSVVKVEGAWKLDLASLMGAMGPAAEGMKKAAEPMAAAIERVAADVQAGKYMSVDDVMGALAMQVMPVIMQQMQGGQGGGG